MNRKLLLAGAMLVLTPLALQPIAAQVSQGTQNIGTPGGPAQDAAAPDPLSSLYEGWMKHTPTVTEVISADHNGAAISDMADALKSGDPQKEALIKQLSKLTYDSRMPADKAKEGVQTMQGLRQDIKDQKALGGKLDMLTKVLDAIDLTSTLAKAAGYAAEKDATGAANTLFKEMTKKLMEAGASLGLSWIPGGQLAGTLAAEGAFEEYVEKELDKREAAVREAEYKEKYLGKPWLPANEVMDDHGNVRTLDPDMYVEKGTGLVKRRSPEEQKLYEEGMHNRWLDGQRWGRIMQDLANGKIDQAKYDELRDDYANRDPNKPWNPDAADPLGAGRFAGTYTGRFSGGGSGSVHFTITGKSVTGTISGVCTKNPCQGDPVHGSFEGSVSDLGMVSTHLTGSFDIKDALIGPLGFSGTLNGVVDRTGGAGEWSGHNKYGDPAGKWSATRNAN